MLAHLLSGERVHAAELADEAGRVRERVDGDARRREDEGWTRGRQVVRGYVGAGDGVLLTDALPQVAREVAGLCRLWHLRGGRPEALSVLYFYFWLLPDG